MALNLCLSKIINFELFNRTTWCVRRTLQSSSILSAKKKEKVKNPLIKTSKWKQIEAISVWRNMTMQELAVALRKDVNHVLEVMTYIDDTYKYKLPYDVIDNFKVVEEIVKKSGKRVKIVSAPQEPKEEPVTDISRRNPSEYLDVRKRNPIVTIMGHVDHGKTTLLDSLRKSAIVDSEFGGITQHIGAFHVRLGEECITFLDTPGHAAFCAMRNRGAKCTDIIVLVVAGDDGVMEQTLQSINMAKSAEVPIIVALNKIDKPLADIEKTKRSLVQHGVQVEDYGGDVQVVPISALKGTNVDLLIESILAQAEILELKTDFSGPVEGVIIESSTDPLRGKLSTLLVQCGTLKKGVILVAGTATCRVRAMFNDSGEPILNALPSTPVQVLGWRKLPFAGDTAIEVPNEKRASSVVRYREQVDALDQMEKDKEIIDKKIQEHDEKYSKQLEERRRLGRFRLRGPREKEIRDEYVGPRVNVIIKGDVTGSVEAILDVLETYNDPLCRLDVVHYGTGPVTPNDVTIADVFDAKIYAFNIGSNIGNISSVRRFNVIYKLIDDVKNEINKVLPLKEAEENIGEANVLQQFLINEKKAKVVIAGCRCSKGVLKKSASFKLIRSNETIFTGTLVSLKHLKNEVDSIKKGMECGLRLSDPDVSVRPGDVVVCFNIVKVPQTVNWDPGF